METGTINNFIKKDLIKKIRSDAKASKTIIPKITNERDLESAIYYHLRKKLKGSKDLKISTNYTFSGVKKRHETTFVQPDIIISQWIDDFHPKYVENINSGKFKVNLQNLAMDKLMEIDIKRNNIYVNDNCTSCNHENYFSYRRDGKSAGRMFGLLGIK